MSRQRLHSRHVNEFTGTLVILVLVALIAAIAWTGYRQRWFGGTVTLRIVLPAAGAAGILQGSQVYFLGTLVGTVSHVVVDAEGRMEAGATIRTDFFRFVREDSFAVVKKKFGVAGDAYFEITRGRGPPLPRKEASILCKELPGTLDAAMEEVRRLILPVLTKLREGLDTWTTLGERLGAGADAWTHLGTDLGESRQHLDRLIGRLDGMVADVEEGKGTAGKLLTDPAVADDLKRILDKSEKSMDQLQDTLKDLGVAGTHLATIGEALAVEAKDLPGLVMQTQQMLYELERLIEGIQGIWPIRGHVEQRRTSTRIPPSEVVP